MVAVPGPHVVRPRPPGACCMSFNPSTTITMGGRGRSAAKDPERERRSGSAFLCSATRVGDLLTLDVCSSGSSRCSSPATRRFFFCRHQRRAGWPGTQRSGEPGMVINERKCIFLPRDACVDLITLDVGSSGSSRCSSPATRRLLYVIYLNTTNHGWPGTQRSEGPGKGNAARKVHCLTSVEIFHVSWFPFRSSRVRPRPPGGLYVIHLKPSEPWVAGARRKDPGKGNAARKLHCLRPRLKIFTFRSFRSGSSRVRPRPPGVRCPLIPPLVAP